MSGWHWREWGMEAAGLGLFMLSAGLCATLLEGPGSPLLVRIADPLARRALTGLAMGLTAMALIYSPWGRRSGAHLNPAITLTFFRLGKVSRADVVAYPLAQLAGGLGGVGVVALLMGGRFTAPPVDWVATRPGRYGAAAAFLAEVAMAGMLMLAVLFCSNRPALARYTGGVAATLVALFITFEAPISGMSLNPARSLASLLPSGNCSGLWIYLTAPFVGMLGAAEIYRRIPGHLPVLCGKLCHDHALPCPFDCGYCLHPREERESR